MATRGTKSHTTVRYAGYKAYIGTTRAKELEHGHGLPPIFIAELRIKTCEESITFWRERMAQTDDPDLRDGMGDQMKRQEARLTRARNTLARAERWARERDEREAREEAEMEERRAMRARKCVACGEDGTDPCASCGRPFCGAHNFTLMGDTLCWDCLEEAKDD